MINALKIEFRLAGMKFYPALAGSTQCYVNFSEIISWDYMKKKLISPM